MKAFREIPAAEATRSILQLEIAAYGYALVRGWLPISDVDQLLSEITGIVSSAGWLLPGHSPTARMANSSAACGDPDPAYHEVYKQIFILESLHTIARRSALHELMDRVAGPNLLIHPKPIGRLIFPNAERYVTKMHQDNTAIGGDPESFTAWFPLHDCPPEFGPLQVLEGSHRFGRQSDSTGYVQAEQAVGGEWASGTIHAGDVLLFHSLTVHAATLNVSSQLRLSIDCRFQNAARAIDPAELVFPGASSNRRTWESTYTNWHSDEFKYYWQKMPLQFRPTLAELATWADTAEPLKMRERYFRILTQIKEQGYS